MHPRGKPRPEGTDQLDRSEASICYANSNGLRVYTCAYLLKKSKPMPQPAVFISEQGAYNAAVRMALSVGTPQEIILRRTKVNPVYKRGELKGYRAAYPINETVVKTILET